MFPLKSPETALKALRRFGRANGRPRRRLKGLYRAPALSFQSVHKELGEEAVKLAMSYAMDASRRMGELLQATERADKETRFGSTRQEQPQKTTKTPTLQELGITRKESSRAHFMRVLQISGSLSALQHCNTKRIVKQFSYENTLKKSVATPLQHRNTLATLKRRPLFRTWSIFSGLCVDTRGLFNCVKKCTPKCTLLECGSLPELHSLSFKRTETAFKSIRGFGRASIRLIRQSFLAAMPPSTVTDG